SGSSNIWLGSKQNSRQTILYVPAALAADKPGLLFLESIDDGATASDLGGVYLWADDSDALRFSATYPTNQDSDGTVLGAATGASLALDNLASVAINTALLDDVGGTDDFGSATKYWKDLWFGGDIYRQSGTFDIKLDFSTPAADRVYTIPDAGAAANVMLDTGAATGITYTKSTANITLGLAAKFDIGAAGNVDFGTGTYNFVGNVDVASGKAVNIDEALTIQGGALITSTAVTLDQDLQVSASVAFADVTATSFMALGDSDQIRLGASGSSDAYIKYDEASGTAGELTFFDREYNAELTLTELMSGTPLNPIVTGDLTISDGQFDWTNTAAGDVNTWTFANTTANIFNIVANSLTNGYAIDINADGIDGGTFIHLDTDETNGAFEFIECFQGTDASVFRVALHGATVLAGTASKTAVLTLTKGDLVIVDGQINADLADVAGAGHNFSTAGTATADTNFITITNSAAAFDKSLLHIDANASGAIVAVDIDYLGAGAAAIDIACEVVTGDGINVDLVDASTGQALTVDLGAWLGTA
ncbi:hypothetical protein LCGC14_2398650, partial [marine sediment metagenome]